MKALENRTVDSKREMDILDKLQEIRARNARREQAGKGLGLDGRVVAGGPDVGGPPAGRMVPDEALHPEEAREEERRRSEGRLGDGESQAGRAHFIGKGP